MRFQLSDLVEIESVINHLVTEGARLMLNTKMPTRHDLDMLSARYEQQARQMLIDKQIWSLDLVVSVTSIGHHHINVSTHWWVDR